MSGSITIPETSFSDKPEVFVYWTDMPQSITLPGTQQSQRWTFLTSMALDDSQIARQNFEAAKNFVNRGSLTADEKVILESFPQEVFCHTDPSVERQTDKIKG